MKSNLSLLTTNVTTVHLGWQIITNWGAGNLSVVHLTLKKTDEKKWTRTSVWETRLKNGSEVPCHYWVWHKWGCSPTDWQGQWLWTSLLRILLLPLLWGWSWLLRWLWACNINTNETYECNKMQNCYFACSAGDQKLKCHLLENLLNLHRIYKNQPRKMTYNQSQNACAENNHCLMKQSWIFSQMFHSLTYRTWLSFSKHSLLHAVCPNTAVRFQRSCCIMYLVVTSIAFRTSNFLEMHLPFPERRNFTTNLMMWYSSTGTVLIIMVFFLVTVLNPMIPRLWKMKYLC